MNLDKIDTKDVKSFKKWCFGHNVECEGCPIQEEGLRESWECHEEPYYKNFSRILSIKRRKKLEKLLS